MGAKKDSRVYLDYNATAPCREAVADAMLSVMRGSDANASSLHLEGREARDIVEESRERVARSLKVKPSEIVFTGGGTEADNMALFGMMSYDGCASHVVASAIEHPCVLEACKVIEKRGFASVSYVGCDETALVDVDSLESLLSGETRLVTVMHANNEVGRVQPIERIADLARKRGIRVHCDAVQSLGRIPVSADAMGVDMLAFSGHKLGGPKGTGVLYVKDDVDLEPLLCGGPHERGRRAGTENVPAIRGLAVAVEAAVNDQLDEAQRLGRLKLEAWNELKDIDGIHLNGDLEDALPNTLNLSFEDLSGEDLMQSLDLDGIAVSTGSACAVGANKASHVIDAMGGEAARSCGPVRISMGYRTTSDDVERCVRTLGATVERLRSHGRKCCCAR
jgi:cysteine desulfurase